MDDTAGRASASGGEDVFDLAVAYVELQNLVLDSLEVDEFLDRVCNLAALIAPGTDCGIMLRHGAQTLSAVRAGAAALGEEALRHLNGRGPGVEAIRASARIEVPSMADESRWNGYGAEAIARGVRSAVSLPILVEGESVGALSLFAPEPWVLAAPLVECLQAFADQVGTALTILLRQARVVALDQQLREALETRAVIDQALGILMYTRKISAGDAFELLRHASQTSNRRTSVIAAELVRTMTGHPFEPPRPLTRRT